MAAAAVVVVVVVVVVAAAVARNDSIFQFKRGNSGGFSPELAREFRRMPDGWGGDEKKIAENK